MSTIRQQLTRRLLVTVALLLGAGGVAVYFCAREALVRQFDDALQTKAQAIATLTEQKAGRLELDFAEEQMRPFDKGGTDFFELREQNGKLVERSPSLGEGHLPTGHGRSAEPVAWNLVVDDGEPARAIGFRFRPQPADEHSTPVQPVEALLVVASSRRQLDRTLMILGWVLAGSGISLLAITALVVPRVLRRGLVPLERLADAAARIDANSLSTRLPAAGLPGELAPITARLNELLERLESSFERERRFSSDVAHEFRTPVAELRSLAELSLKIPDARPADADQEFLAIALHLQNLTEHLLALARGENGTLQVQLRKVSLRPLVKEVCDALQAKAAARGITVNCRAPAACELHTDPDLLRSILSNMLNNAVEYSPPASEVNVEIDSNPAQFALRVTNTVDDLEEEDLPRLCERFWRKDAARSPDGHTGLGLSLARVFARALGCELNASFVEPNRLAMTLNRR